tara:strand:- start:265 stop:486 length:222 start_codon:yes stop_codon:yes gene_type:complete
MIKKVKQTNNKGKTLAFIKHLRNGSSFIMANNEKIRLFTDIDKNEYLIYSDTNNKVINIEKLLDVNFVNKRSI